MLRLKTRHCSANSYTARPGRALSREERQRRADLYPEISDALQQLKDDTFTNLEEQPFSKSMTDYLAKGPVHLTIADEKVRVYSMRHTSREGKSYWVRIGNSEWVSFAQGPKMQAEETVGQGEKSDLMLTNET